LDFVKKHHPLDFEKNELFGDGNAINISSNRLI